MARAKRHYIPGYIWHITHQCNKREFLLRFSRDRLRYLQWLYQARKRYGLTILNYIVTSNHVHLLVMDDGERGVIPKSMQLMAGRNGQEFNQRMEKWSDSIAVGSRSFVEKVKALLGFRAKGRDIMEEAEGYQVRLSGYKHFLTTKYTKYTKITKNNFGLAGAAGKTSYPS